MSLYPPNGGSDVSALAGIRTVLIRPDLVAAQPRPRLPTPVKKKIPCRRSPDGEPVERAGSRDWFGDHLFVETQHDRLRAGFSVSVAVHTLVIALVIVVSPTIARTALVRVGPPLTMPAFLFIEPVVDPPSLTARRSERSERTSDAPPPPLAADEPTLTEPDAIPLEAPSSIGPETGTESADDGVDGGSTGGVPGGVGRDPSSSGASSSGPMRLGVNLRPPRKIKDVRPVYPQIALLNQTRGAVIIEVTIGIDGKIQDATIVQSVPGLDEAALAAVRQWIYEPTTLNGAIVALIMTVVVNFNIQ